MRIENINLLTSGAISLDANVNGNAAWIGHAALAAIQIAYTLAGVTPSGTFKLQGSCDPGKPNSAGLAQQSSGIINWTDIPSQSQNVTASGVVMFNIVDPGYQWIRVVWAYSAGTGNQATSMRLTTKGI